MNHKTYHVETKNNMLIFKTSSFSVYKGSVLHSGIYNKEFASLLASTALAGLAYFLFASFIPSFYLIAAIVFAVAFPLFRRFIFKGKFLEIVFDRKRGSAEIYLYGISKKKKAEIQIKNIKEIRIEQKKDRIENPDGVAFVEKISLQHGMVIPGFGEETTFYMLKLMLADSNERIIYADSDIQSVTSAQDEIKDFLKI